MKMERLYEAKVDQAGEERERRKYGLTGRAAQGPVLSGGAPRKAAHCNYTSYCLRSNPNAYHLRTNIHAQIIIKQPRLCSKPPSGAV